jgi:coenzyme Q-binding protein COQ10
MPTHSDTRISPYSPAQLYAMVLDIEKYPEFLPWCRAARILERAPEHFIGELIVSFSHLTERYSSKVVGVPPREEIPSPLRGGLGRGASNEDSVEAPSSNLLPRGEEASPVASLVPTTEGRIDVTLVKGPFSHLSNHWRFEPLPDGGCKIHFEVDFKFKSGLLEKLIGGLFTRAVEKMSESFMTRADTLYGTTPV